MVDMKLPHGAAAGTRRACCRSRVLLLKMMSDAPQAIVAWPAVAFDVRITRDLVPVVHAVAEDTVALINYHSTFFA